VKRISSFDDAQDGEPVEPYLASKDVALFFRPALHASQDTSDEGRIVIAVEAFVNDAAMVCG
jgi:hypothetical protein